MSFLNSAALPAAIAAILAAACVSVQPAKMALPEGLDTRTERTTLQGAGGGTSGSFEIAGVKGTFQRSASRVEFFDALLSFDRGRVRYALVDGDRVRAEAQCGMRQTEGQLGVVQFTPKKLTFTCDFSGTGQTTRLTLQEARERSNPLAPHGQRQGTIVAGDLQLAIRSSHDLVGSPLKLPIPIGYVIEHNGRAVAAVELNGLSPTVLLPLRGQPQLREPTLLAAIALALLWDPAMTAQ